MSEQDNKNPKNSNGPREARPNSNIPGNPNSSGPRDDRNRRPNNRNRRPNRDQNRDPNREARPPRQDQDNQGGAPRNSDNRGAAPRTDNRPSRNNRNNRQRNSHRGGGPQQQGARPQGPQNPPQKAKHHMAPEERLMNQYWIHLEEYLQARRGFYVHAHVENEAQKIKYKRAYLRALEKWRTWQDSLSDQDKVVIQRRNYEHRLENGYSVSNQVDYDRSKIDWEGPFLDQHFLKRQIEADYKGDIEETSGTMDDYQKIKDGFVPAKYRET